MATRTKRSVALAVFDDGGRLLLVRRPADDAEFPGMWGLPAASCAPGESPEAAALRIGPQKLGATVTLEGSMVRGRQERQGYVIEMVLYRARLLAAVPRLPTRASGAVTLYDAWRWGRPRDLKPAARAGSLCSRLLLDALGYEYDGP